MLTSVSTNLREAKKKLEGIKAQQGRGTDLIRKPTYKGGKKRFYYSEEPKGEPEEEPWQKGGESKQGKTYPVGVANLRNDHRSYIPTEVSYAKEGLTDKARNAWNGGETTAQDVSEYYFGQEDEVLNYAGQSFDSLPQDVKDSVLGYTEDLTSRLMSMTTPDSEEWNMMKDSISREGRANESYAKEHISDAWWWKDVLYCNHCGADLYAEASWVEPLNDVGDDKMNRVVPDHLRNHGISESYAKESNGKYLFREELSGNVGAEDDLDSIKKHLDKKIGGGYVFLNEHDQSPWTGLDLGILPVVYHTDGSIGEAEEQEQDGWGDPEQTAKDIYDLGHPEGDKESTEGDIEDYEDSQQDEDRIADDEQRDGEEGGVGSGRHKEGKDDKDIKFARGVLESFLTTFVSWFSN